MRIERLISIGQVRRIKMGDIIPMLDESNYIDGRFEGMLIEREGDTMIFLGRNPSEKDTWFKYLIPDVSKNGFVDILTNKYIFDGINVADLESVEENYPENKWFIKKYKKEIS